MLNKLEFYFNEDIVFQPDSQQGREILVNVFTSQADDDDVEVFVNICPLTRMSPELFSPSIREFTLTHNEAHAYARRRNAWT